MESHDDHRDDILFSYIEVNARGEKEEMKVAYEIILRSL
jgi:hypothetical protein